MAKKSIFQSSYDFKLDQQFLKYSSNFLMGILILHFYVISSLLFHYLKFSSFYFFKVQTIVSIFIIKYSNLKQINLYIDVYKSIFFFKTLITFYFRNSGTVDTFTYRTRSDLSVNQSLKHFALTNHYSNWLAEQKDPQEVIIYYEWIVWCLFHLSFKRLTLEFKSVIYSYM